LKKPVNDIFNSLYLDLPPTFKIKSGDFAQKALAEKLPDALLLNSSSL
jgi:hypothetical protein